GDRSRTGERCVAHDGRPSESWRGIATRHRTSNGRVIERYDQLSGSWWVAGAVVRMAIHIRSDGYPERADPRARSRGSTRDTSRLSGAPVSSQHHLELRDSGKEPGIPDERAATQHRLGIVPG